MRASIKFYNSFIEIEGFFVVVFKNTGSLWHITLIPGLGGRGIVVSLRPAWSTELVLGQPKLYKETLSWKIAK